MPKLRLYQFDLTIIEVQDKVDKIGKRYLLAKGYHRRDEMDIKGVHYPAFDSFSSIQLYGSDQILDETIRRLASSKKQKLKIEVLDSDLVNKLKGKKLLSMLVIYFFDFKTHRIGTRKLIKKLS